MIHSLPGRVRVHVPGLDPPERSGLERQLCGIDGVRHVRANATTQNVLVQFDRARTDEHAIVAALRGPEGHELPCKRPAPRRAQRAPAVHRGRVSDDAVRDIGGQRRRARIAVRGLDREPRLASRVVERLSALRGVWRVNASQLTGRVLVDYSAHALDVEDLVAQVAKLELPELPGEDTPSHPLDPAPLIQSTARVIGSAVGLGLIGVRRALSGTDGAQGGGAGAQIAGAIGIVEGLPPIERRLEDLLGRNAAQLTLSGLTIISLGFAGSPLGLAVSGAGALRLMIAVRARRSAWRRYEEELGEVKPTHPGARVRLEPGRRVPLAGVVRSGFGTACSCSGEVIAATPGVRLDAGARVLGGRLTVELDAEAPFTPAQRSTPPTPTIYDRYLDALPPASLAYAAAIGLLSRSPARALTALLLVNPRAALIGAESADNGAASRSIRQGATVVGSREKRPICLSNAVIVDCPRVLLDVPQLQAVSAAGQRDRGEVMRIAAGVSAAAGSPWGAVFAGEQAHSGVDGTFDGRAASAEIGGERWLLCQRAPTARQRGEDVVLELRRSGRRSVVATVTLRLAAASGLEQLLDACERLGVPVEVVGGIPGVVAALPQARGMRAVSGDVLERIHELQAAGALVTVVSDSARSACAFAACDLAIALSCSRDGPFAARADLLVPDLATAGAVIDTAARRDAVVRDSVIASSLANVAGAAWGLGGNPRFQRASQATYLAALASIAGGYARLRGGAQSRSVAERLTDPQPERFGRMSADEALAALDGSARGLTRAEARARRRPERSQRTQGSALGSAITDQLRSPLTAVLAAGAGASLALGALGDAAMIGAVIAVNSLVAAWQEHQAGRAAEALQAMSARTATVLRDGRTAAIPVEELVPGDVIVLAAGDRVAADARLIEAEDLEVDEAALTGESLPVAKHADGGTEASRIVQEGSDVTVGTASALVVAVGGDTRMGATAAALALQETRASPLGQKLGQMFGEGLPVIVGGGLLVTAGGLLWGRPLVPQLALGASVAIGAVPEGLPLLAGVAQAAIARRLASRGALVRRLSAVETLGRVDVACADKTGTLTVGRPSLTCVSDVDGHCQEPERLSGAARQILAVAALASPEPDAPNLAAHPTDVAVVEGAQRARVAARGDSRDEEIPFEPSRGFHATKVKGRLFFKGAPEVLARRCAQARRAGTDVPLGDADRAALLRAAERLSAQGLRVLMVAEGLPAAAAEDHTDLRALGFVGISDPLRPAVPAAVRRCQAAGVRVLMLTGDHPATALATAKAAGLAENGIGVLTGQELAALDDDELERQLERTRVIARISPLDKLRIVEALRRRGHVVAMTGDGVNDAPALRLADVGVAMGRTGTDVAREAADVVLADDDFATLVETLVEGRGFWHNIRRALGLLLGGNAGELALMIAAGASGLAAPLTTRQVLAVNLVTDVLPALAVAVQEPEHRDLAGLAREGTAALDAPLRRGILHRGIATAAPSFAAYLLASRARDPARARAVAFTSVVGTQLAQTLDLGRVEGRLSPEVLGAVAGSAAFVAAALMLPPFQGFLGLAAPTPFGLALCAAAMLASVAISRSLAAENGLKISTNNG